MATRQQHPRPPPPLRRDDDFGDNDGLFERTFCGDVCCCACDAAAALLSGAAACCARLLGDADGDGAGGGGGGEASQASAGTEALLGGGSPSSAPWPPPDDGELYAPPQPKLPLRRPASYSALRQTSAAAGDTAKLLPADPGGGSGDETDDDVCPVRGHPHVSPHAFR